jgi:hypothetical protein
MTHRMRSAFLLLIASLIATTASGQEPYFRSLEIPPNSAGTCMPIPNKRGERVSFAGHLIIKSVIPGQDRDLTVFVDTLRRTIGYSELNSAYTGNGIGTLDLYVAAFKQPSRVIGFSTHSTTKMPVPDLAHIDTASLRKMRESAKTVSTKRPLNSDEIRRAREIAEWLRKRCPATTSQR